MAYFGRFWPVALAGWVVAGATLLALGTIVARRGSGAGGAGGGEIRFIVPPPPSVSLESVLDSGYALAPDGRSLAFRGRDASGVQRLYVRDFASLDERVIAGTEEARDPFWSPDGRRLAFFTRGRLATIPLAGGTAEGLCDVDGDPRGGTWGAAGDILFAVSGGPLFRVSANGGTPVAIMKPDAARGESGMSRPRFLPDGRRFLVHGLALRAEDRTLYLGTLDGGDPAPLLKTPFKAEYANPGWVLYVRGTALVAQRLRTGSPALLGDPIVVLDRIDIAVVPGLASFSVSDSGTIAWAAGSRATLPTEPDGHDHDGSKVADLEPPAAEMSKAPVPISVLLNWRPPVR